ncbi:MAG TPA: zinc-ribbon domain-containing protein, partial [Desulfuromonadales bacterium]|nr:zinc-ribbon domain-containing protein [Desulfuromonadales bacterium]
MRTITCPHCGFSRDLSEEAIPERATAANCPSCGKRFALPEGTTPPERPLDQQADEGVQPKEFSASSRQTGSVRDTEDRIVCPVCSTAQEPSENCVHCGLIFSKWEELRKEGKDFYLADSGELLDESLKGKNHRRREVQARAG